MRRQPLFALLGALASRIATTLLSSAEESHMTADQNDQLHDENPHQGASHSFGKNFGASSSTGATSGGVDRERSIATGREGPRSTGVSRPSYTSPVWSSGHGPFALMRRMTEDMNRLFENLGFGRGHGLSSPYATGFDRDLWGATPTPDQMAWLPQVETFRRGDKLVVRADLPGLKKEDVKAEIEDGVLTIWGERSAEREDNGDDFYRSERSYGQFCRTVPLPDGADADHTEASFKDGVLEVAIPAPKQSERKAKPVQIR
jgi:HSP20 family protein